MSCDLDPEAPEPHIEDPETIIASWDLALGRLMRKVLVSAGWGLIVTDETSPVPATLEIVGSVALDATEANMLRQLGEAQ